MLTVSRRTAAQINGDIECGPMRDSHQLSLRLTYLVVNTTNNILLRERKIVLHPVRWQSSFCHRTQIPCLQEYPTAVAINIWCYDENSRQGGLFNLHWSSISGR